jgi:LPXTG-motif cell wall-anchored protein
MKVPLTFKEILPWLLLGLAAAAIIAGIIWYLRKRRKNEPIIELKPKVVVLPDERALSALEELRQKKLWQSGMVKQYYTELTDILRIYIEDAFQVPAMESVTDEIIEGLEGKGSIERKDIRDLQGILVAADLVKFAKAQPLPDENGTAFDNSVSFVKNTSINRKDAKAQ